MLEDEKTDCDSTATHFNKVICDTDATLLGKQRGKKILDISYQEDAGSLLAEIKSDYWRSPIF